MADAVSLATAGPVVGREILPRQLGRYELLACLATGGMGEVHLACTRGVGGFERLVVVKCALPAISNNSEQMLLAEARLAATLQHTNIVAVHDVGIEHGVVFLAMEYLHGQDLRAVVARSWGTGRPLGLDPAIAIALSICAGLHYAHDKRDAEGGQLDIVHRDVSPSNAIVTYDGGVKIIDFGIAKATSLPSETQIGTVKGKPGYMSPEQCRCEPLDRRSDVFCVGIVLYELTTGKRPFTGAGDYAMAKAIVETDPVWPTAFDPSYPSELEAIVRRALAKDRRDRYPTAQALHSELAELASKNRLDVSQFALQRAMASLFDAELGAWQAAQVSEQSIVDYVVHRTAVPAIAATAATRVEPTVRRRRWPIIVAATTAAAAAIAIALAFHESSAQPKVGAGSAIPQPVTQPAVSIDAAIAEPDAATPAVRVPVHHVDRPKKPKKTDPDEIIR